MADIISATTPQIPRISQYFPACAPGLLHYLLQTAVDAQIYAYSIGRFGPDIYFAGKREFYRSLHIEKFGGACSKSRPLVEVAERMLGKTLS